jgi:heavy-metal-associated domain-containing protein
MIILVHDVPGRLRFFAPRVKRDQQAAAALRRRARAVPGVAAASANPLTGSLLVHHDRALATRARILDALEVADPGPALAPPPSRREPIRAAAPSPATRGDAIAEFVANAVAEHLVERAVRMAVAALL